MPPAASPALPLRITRMEACFVIRDAGKRALAYVYFENDATRANITGMMSEPDALAIAQRIARTLSQPEG